MTVANANVTANANANANANATITAKGQVMITVPFELEYNGQWEQQRQQNQQGQQWQRQQQEVINTLLTMIVDNILQRLRADPRRAPGSKDIFLVYLPYQYTPPNSIQVRIRMMDAQFDQLILIEQDN